MVLNSLELKYIPFYWLHPILVDIFLGIACMLGVIERLGFISNNSCMAEQLQALTCWREVDWKSGFQHEYFTEE